MPLDLKVLHVYRTYFPDPPGGIAEVMRQIALATKPMGVESRIFTLSPNPQPTIIERPEGRVYRSRSWAEPASCNLGGLSAVCRFSQLAEWADVIHYQFPWPFADLLHLATQSRKPAILTYQSDIVRQRVLGALYTPLMRHILRSMDAVVATSPAYSESSPVLSQAVDKRRIHVIPNGIVEESYADSVALAEQVDVSGCLGLEQDEYFLFVGALRYYKGLHILLEAMRELDCKLVIAGDGRERESLEKQAHTLPPNRVVFLGQVSDIKKMALIRQCRALVLPSHLRSEAFGMVLVEAMMCGRPVISCEIGTGTSYVNEHGMSGIVVEPNSPKALANAMRCLLADKDFARRAGKGARKRYESLFSGSPLGIAYASLYREVMS